MNIVKRSFRNIAMMMSGQIVTWASTLILSAAYGRFLGATGFGELYLATSFIALVGFPIEFSFNQQLIRDIAREPKAAHRYVTMGLVLKATLWVGLFLISFLLTFALHYSDEVRWLIVISGFSLLTMGIATTLRSVQTAYLDAGMAKFGDVIEKGFDCVVALLLLRAGAGVIPISIVLVVGSALGMMWQIYRTVKLIGIRIEWSPEVARTLIRSGLAFLAYGVIGVLYYRIDTILLSVFATDTAIGVYGAAYRLFDTMTFIPTIVVSAIMSPILSKYAVDADKSKLRLAVDKSVMAMLLCALPAAAGLIVTAPNIIGFIYHREDFTGSEYVLQALAVGLIALYLNSVLTTVLVSTGQERKLPLMAIAALIFNVGLNLFLIPRYMDMGAAWATSLTEVLLFGIGLWLIDRSLFPLRLFVTAAKILAASLVMGLVAYSLTRFNILVIIPIAAVVYVAAIIALRVLPDEDITQLRIAFARFLPRRFRMAEASPAAPQLVVIGAPDGVNQATMAARDATAETGLEPAPAHTSLESLAAAVADELAYEDVGAISPELEPVSAHGERASSDSVPLSYPIRMGHISVEPNKRNGGNSTSTAQRRIQRRLAQLDDHQIAALLSQRQLGRLALRVQRVGSDRPGAAAAAGSRPTPRPTPRPTSSYSVEFERLQPQKPNKDNRTRHKRRARRSGAPRASSAHAIAETTSQTPERMLANA